MNTILRVLKMPWLASIRSAQSYLFAFVWFMLSADVCKRLPVGGTARQFGTAVLVFALIIAWKMVANSIWLARDARTLRLPGIERDADYALPLFAFASVVLPAVILGTVFGNVVLWLVSLALAGASTLAFCLLPTALAVPALLAVVTLVVFGGWQPPLPGDPEFLAWAVPALIVLMVASVQRWIAIRRAFTLELTPWLQATIAGGRSVHLRKLRGEAYRTTDFTRRDNPGKPARDRLDKVGPAHPVRSIRTAMDHSLVPMNVRMASARHRRMQVVVCALLFCGPVFADFAQHHFGTAAVIRFSPQLLLIFTISLTVPYGSNKAVASRWNSRNAGLPLLALLPRLDAPAHLKRHALEACVTRNMSIKLWFSVSAASALAVLQLPAMFYVYLALVLLCGTLLDFASAASLLAGKPWRSWVGSGLYFLTIMIPLVATTSWGVKVTGGTHPQVQTLGWPALACVALWIVWSMLIAIVFLRGWRALQRRPHPFLPESPA